VLQSWRESVVHFESVLLLHSLAGACRLCGFVVFIISVSISTVVSGFMLHIL
jgi:hypothetical protein